jgi:hypothetical protein
MSEKIVVLTDEIRAQLAPEFKALEDAAFAKGKSDGASAERDRIKAVESQGENLPGHEALIQEMKFDGKTTGPEAAVKVLAAEKTKKAERVRDIRADAPKPVPASVIDDPTKESGGEKPNHNELAKQANEYQAMRAKEGVEVSNIDAVKFVYQRAGVPLK